MISSAQNPKVKFIRSLNGRPKERHAAHAFLAEGVRLVEEAVAAQWPFRFVLYSKDLSQRGKGLIKTLEGRQIEVEQVEARLLQSLSETETSQGLLAVLEDQRLPITTPADFVLIPDSIHDPGNLGTLLRSAEAAGVQAVFLPPETADAFAPKVVRAGMGVHFRLPLQAMTWEEIGIHTRGMQIYLADMDGPACWEIAFQAPLALIIGGEAEGASQAARKLAHRKVSVPMAGKTESLNAAVAGSILLFEVLRQKIQQ